MKKNGKHWLEGSGVVLLLLFTSLVYMGCPASNTPQPSKKRVAPTSGIAQKTVSAGKVSAPRRSKPVVKTPLTQRFHPKKQPFAYVFPQLKPVKGVGIPRAKTCGTCHTAIYKEWKQTTHATALRDIQFQAELSKASSPKWLCLNCHIPVQNQRRYFVRGLLNNNVLKPVLVPNPGFDPVMQKESITCATCHVRQNKKGESVIIGVMGSKHAPHPIRKDRKMLRNVCLRCHNPQGKRLTRHLMCWFKTKDEHGKSKLAGKKDCVSCHMPSVKRRLVPSWKHLPKRKSHHHHWVGGGVPKWFRIYKTLLKRQYKPGLKAKVLRLVPSWRQRKVQFKTLLHNAQAGHWLPTADPERFLLVVAVLQDKSGKELSRTKYRIGQTWKWEPKAMKVGDNRLRNHEKRIWKSTLRWKPGQTPAKVLLTVYHVRLSTHTARYMKKHTRMLKTSYMPNAQNYIRNIGRTYPLASFVHREQWSLKKGRLKVWTLPELIQLSVQEQHKPLKSRDY